MRHNDFRNTSDVDSHLRAMLFWLLPPQKLVIYRKMPVFQYYFVVFMKSDRFYPPKISFASLHIVIWLKSGMKLKPLECEVTNMSRSEDTYNLF